MEIMRICAEWMNRRGEAKLVARALLPDNVGEGSRLHYEMLQYTLL